MGAGVGFYFWGQSKKLARVTLNHFSPFDFAPWFPVMSEKLLINLEKTASFLYPLGYTFIISRVGKDDQSGGQHDVFAFGEVRAIDVNILLDGQPLTKAELRTVYELIRGLGIWSGLGVYPNWNRAGMHLDVREDRTPQNPATWGDVGYGGDHQYTSVSVALV